MLRWMVLLITVWIADHRIPLDLRRSGLPATKRNHFEIRDDNAYRVVNVHGPQGDGVFTGMPAMTEAEI